MHKHLSFFTDVNIVSNGQVHENNSYIVGGAVVGGTASPHEISCFLQGIQLFEANVTWFYPSGLAVPTTGPGRDAHQVDNSSSSNRRVESVLVWSPQRLDDEAISSEGFYCCRVSTPTGVQESVCIGLFHQDPSERVVARSTVHTYVRVYCVCMCVCVRLHVCCVHYVHTYVPVYVWMYTYVYARIVCIGVLFAAGGNHALVSHLQSLVLQAWCAWSA